MSAEEESVGKRIQDCRNAKDVSQSKLAELTGVSAAAIWQWEKRGKVPRPQTLRKIANALKVSPEYLLTGKTESGSENAGAGDITAVWTEGATTVAQQIEKIKSAVAAMIGVDAAQISIEVKVANWDHEPGEQSDN